MEYMKGLNISLILTSDRQTTKLEWCSEKICTSQVKSVYTLYGSSIYENKKERKLVLIFIFFACNAYWTRNIKDK